MSVVGVAALDQQRDAAARRSCVGGVPDREFVVVSRRPREHDRCWRGGGQGMADHTENGFLDTLGYLVEVVHPRSMKRHIGSDDQSGGERLAGLERVASFCHSHDAFPGKCVIELTKNRLKVGHWLSPKKIAKSRLQLQSGTDLFYGQLLSLRSLASGAAARDSSFEPCDEVVDERLIEPGSGLL